MLVPRHSPMMEHSSAQSRNSRHLPEPLERPSPRHAERRIGCLRTPGTDREAATSVAMLTLTVIHGFSLRSRWQLV